MAVNVEKGKQGFQQTVKAEASVATLDTSALGQACTECSEVTQTECTREPSKCLDCCSCEDHSLVKAPTAPRLSAQEMEYVSAPFPTGGYDKAGHRAEMHGLVTERRKAGKPVWGHRVAIRDITRDFDSSPSERAKAVAEKVRTSQWFKDADENDEVVQVVEELEDVEDTQHYEAAMHGLYDAADYDRVWLG